MYDGAGVIWLVNLYSNIKMMHGPIRIRFKKNIGICQHSKTLAVHRGKILEKAHKQWNYNM
jgi:hypothetical protein